MTGWMETQYVCGDIIVLLWLCSVFRGCSESKHPLITDLLSLRMKAS